MEGLECDVCCESFNVDARRPKVLSCGHTLCLMCVSVAKTCHVDRKDIGDVSALADNYYIISCIEGSRTSTARKFHCMTCQDVASPVCEEEHDIRSLKKVRQDQSKPHLSSVQSGVELQRRVVGQLVELLHQVGETSQRLVGSSTEQQDELQHTLEQVQSVLETCGNQAAWLDATNALQQTKRQCEERRPLVQRQLEILESRGVCHLQLELEERAPSAGPATGPVDRVPGPEGSGAARADVWGRGRAFSRRCSPTEPRPSQQTSTATATASSSRLLAANVNLAVDSEASRVARFLLFLLNQSGNLGTLSADPNDQEGADVTDEEDFVDVDEWEEEEEEIQGAACLELTERRGRSSPLQLRGFPLAARRWAAKKQEERDYAYSLMVNLDEKDVVPNMQPFDCPVCMVSFEAGEGITLKDCLHSFCRDCLRYTVQHSEEAAVKCPYRDDDYSCEITLTDREIKALVSADLYEQYVGRSIKVAESNMENTFHCKTPDCVGWYEFEVGVNQFMCDVCLRENCLQCQVSHEGENCATFQERIKRLAATDEEARATQAALDAMLADGNAMRCPKCAVIITKRAGCDALLCSMCKTDICWATKQARWGPKGRGDTSGGCRCKVNNLKCHPACGNCH